MLILLHTSKTMRPRGAGIAGLSTPVLLEQAEVLATYLKTLSTKRLGTAMGLSPKLAGITHDLIASWTSDPTHQRAAIDSFLGDIYSGLQVAGWSDGDRGYANKHLRILSGLYGALRPLDGIYPYRLELGYKLPLKKYSNLYTFWGDAVSNALPNSPVVINLAALEYSKVAASYLKTRRVITPSFLTMSPKTGEPTFVTVHAKVARGSFARWLIKNQVENPDRLVEFSDIGYVYDAGLSSSDAPVFVAQTYGGLGLSVRLT